MTKLFTAYQVKKFFNILDNLSGSIPVDNSNYPWKDYQTIYTKDSNHIPSTREIFVHRTINKWLVGKYLIIYRTSDLEVTYKQYVSLSRLAYYNDWGSGYINVGLIDYSQPYNPKLFGGEKITHNKALKLEGEWCKDGTKHHQLLEMVSIHDIPDKEYVFKRYDWSKYPKRGVKREVALKKITTTISFTAKTEHEAYKAKNAHKDAGEIAELIEIKSLIIK